MISAAEHIISSDVHMLMAGRGRAVDARVRFKDVAARIAKKLSAEGRCVGDSGLLHE